MKNYIGISRDHSGSMRSISLSAGRDYNNTISSIKQESERHNIDTIVSVVECGVGRSGIVRRDVVNSNVTALKPIEDYSYIADGYSTPLFDSVGELIALLESVPDKNDPDVSFLVMIITDGEENSSKKWTANSLTRKIQELQATDRWSFIFRVPRGGRRRLRMLGIPDGNILEWDQTEQGMQASSQATCAAFTSYYSDRSLGKTSTQKFYTDLSDISINDVQNNLQDISKSIQTFRVKTSEHGIQIRDFVEKKIKTPMVKGTAFYQLSKTEKVQEYKKIIIRDRIKGHVYSGSAARHMLGLPQYGEIKLIPGTHGQYDVFIQSTSVNRKLVADTDVLLWMNA